jgi:hypothetical protein
MCILRPVVLILLLEVFDTWHPVSPRRAVAHKLEPV